MSENLAKKLVSNELIKQKNAEFSEFLEGLEFKPFRIALAYKIISKVHLKMLALRLYMGKQNHRDYAEIELFENNASKFLG